MNTSNAVSIAVHRMSMMVKKPEKVCDEGEGKEWPQILAILTATMLSLSGGAFFTWTSSSIPRLINDEYVGEIDLNQASYLTILPSIAVIIVGPFTGRLIDIVGRKRALMLTAVPQIIGWVMTACGGSIYVFYIARFIAGIGDSCLFCTVPCYVSEVSTPKVRGRWGNAIALCIFTGSLLMNIIGAYFTITASALIFLVLPVMTIFTITLFPESPYYLIMTNREDEARASLQFLRRKVNVEDELQQLVKDVQRQQSEPGCYKDLFRIRTNRKALLIAVVLRGAQQFSGIAAISMYTQIIFQRSGSDFSASTSAIIFSAVLVVVSVFCCAILEKIGKRVAMLTSCFGCGVVLLLQGVYFYLNDFTDINLEAYTLFPLISMILYVVFFTIGLGIVPTLMLGELFSSSIKGKALCVTNMCFGIYICLNSEIFSVLTEYVGLFSPFIFFGACCVLSTILSYFIVPETSGKTLEEIQQSLK